MEPDATKPAFQQAIPHVGVVFCPLLKVVIFGSFGESRNGLIWGPEMVSFGDPKWSHLGTRNGPVWGPEMIPFGDSKLTRFGTALGTENRDWDRYGSSRCSGASWSCCEAIRRMREGV